MSSDVEGIPRSYFYQRLANGMDHLVRMKFLQEIEPMRWPADKPIPATFPLGPVQAAGWWSELENPGLGDEIFKLSLAAITEEEEVIIEVDLQESLNRLKFCPCCGEELEMPASSDMERTCTCGDFKPTKVYGDGDVVFSFHMIAREKA